MLLQLNVSLNPNKLERFFELTLIWRMPEHERDQIEEGVSSLEGKQSNKCGVKRKARRLYVKRHL